MSDRLIKTVRAMSRAWRSVAHAWRFDPYAPAGRVVVPTTALDNYVNLISDGMNFSTLRSTINNAIQGRVADGLALFEDMERKYGRLRAVAETRRKSLTGLEWEVISAADVEEVADETLAQEAADFTRGAFRGLGSLKRGLGHLAKGIGPNLAVLELVWENSRLVELVDVPSWRLDMDAQTPGLVRVITADNRIGVPAVLPKFSVHMPHGADYFPLRNGLSTAQALLFLSALLAFADWKTYLEIFGMPTRVGKYQPGASADEKSELADMLANVGSKAWMMFSSACDVEFRESSQRGTAPYKEFVEHCAKETTILWLGGHLSADTTGGTGTYAAGKVQDEVKDDLRDDDIEVEGETVRTQIIAPMCWYRFRRSVPVPYFRRRKPEIIDRIQEAEVAIKAQQAGLKVSKKQLYERLNLAEPEDESDALTPAAQFFEQGLSEGM